jgi:cation diffusion facilitator family transporter
MSDKMPDREHPFGHGRFEYISALMISFIIMFVGIELFRTALGKILHPESVKLNLIMLFILSLSVFIKVWMFSYNRYIGKKINSEVNFATAADSLNDVFATSAVILSTGAGYFLNLKIDGYVGVAVSILVIFSGFKIAKNTISVLLGKPPEKEQVEKICSMLLSDSGIIGVHDLIIHDYGPGRIIASIHAEAPDSIKFVEVHSVIDELEDKIADELGVNIVIHMDPISMDESRNKTISKSVINTIHEVDSSLNMQNFRIIDGENRTTLNFDLVIPPSIVQSEYENIRNTIAEKIAGTNNSYNVVINTVNLNN